MGIDYRIRSIDLLTHKLKITIWDTAGQDKVKVLPATTIRKAEGILYVFDVNNQITVSKLKEHIEACKDIISDNYPSIIGNKIDIEERVVTEYEGKMFADKMEIPYFEMSALSGEEVSIGFYYIIRKIMVMKHYKINEFDEYVQNSLKEQNDISKEKKEEIPIKEDNELIDITVSKSTCIC